MTNITPVSGKWETKRTITVDNRTSELIVTLAFNDKNGQYKIGSNITTVQVSRNAEMRAAVLQQQAEMLEEAMAYALTLRDEWGANNEDGDPDQLKIWGGADDEQEGEADPGEQPETETEDVQLSLSAPKKGKAKKAKASEEIPDESNFDDLPM